MKEMMSQTPSVMVEEVMMKWYIPREKLKSSGWSPWVNDEGILKMDHEKDSPCFRIDMMQIASDEAIDKRKRINDEWKRINKKIYIHYMQNETDEAGTMWIALSEGQVGRLQQVLKEADKSEG